MCEHDGGRQGRGDGGGELTLRSSAVRSFIVSATNGESSLVQGGGGEASGSASFVVFSAARSSRSSCCCSSRLFFTEAEMEGGTRLRLLLLLLGLAVRASFFLPRPSSYSVFFFNVRRSGSAGPPVGPRLSLLPPRCGRSVAPQRAKQQPGRKTEREREGEEARGRWY